MAGEIKLNDVSVATESGGTVTIAPNNVTFAANHAGIKAALNASGSAGVYACRAWVNFDGTTNTAGFCSIRASGNVSTVADNGGTGGDYTVNFATAMPDANYSVVATTKEADDNSAQTTVVMIHSLGTSSFKLTAVRANVSLIDPINLCVTVIR